MLTAVAIVAAAPVGADPGTPTPAPPMPVLGVECNGTVVPLDPRVSVSQPLGTLMYRAMLEAMCGQPAD